MITAIHESFPPGVDSAEKILLSLVRKETDHKILSCFLKEGSLSQQRLTDLTRLAKSTISVHLATLLESGVVRTKAGEERKIFELTDRAKIETMLDRYPHVLSKATHRFIDLWDF